MNANERESKNELIINFGRTKMEWKRYANTISY